MPKKRGFTLIELLIVVLIVAILAAIAVPNFLEFQVRAKMARCKADMRSIALAIEAYCVDEGEYVWSAYTFHLLTTPIAYMSSLPDDPFGPILRTDFGYSKVLGMYGSPIKPRYIYTGPASFQNNDFSGRYNIHWVMVGLGPDRGWFDNSGGTPLGGSYPQYDPSNGTISRGNIERCGPGNIPGDHFREVWDIY